jgi:hypothetical protein
MRLPSPNKPAAPPDQPKPPEQSPSVTTNDSVEALSSFKDSLELRAAQLNAQVQTLQKSQAQLLEGQEKLAQQLTGLAASNQALSTQQNISHELAERTRHDLRTLAEAYANDPRPVTNSIAAPAPLPPLPFSVNGVTIHPHTSGWEIRFDAPLFDRDDHFKIGSKALIVSVAKALVRTQERINIRAVGFADSEPPTWPWSKPTTDATLGQIRADRVKTVLDRLSLIPSSALSATNAPSTDLPHPGESRRNRTVVLQVSRQP